MGVPNPSWVTSGCIWSGSQPRKFILNHTFFSKRIQSLDRRSIHAVPCNLFRKCRRLAVGGGLSVFRLMPLVGWLGSAAVMWSMVVSQLVSHCNVSNLLFCFSTYNRPWQVSGLEPMQHGFIPLMGQTWEVRRVVYSNINTPLHPPKVAMLTPWASKKVRRLCGKTDCLVKCPSGTLRHRVQLGTFRCTSATSTYNRHRWREWGCSTKCPRGHLLKVNLDPDLTCFQN